MLWNMHSDPIVVNIDFNPATIGNNTVITGISGTSLFIRGLAVTVDGAAVLTFKSGSTALGTAKLADNGSFNLAEIPGADGEPFWKSKALGDSFIIQSDAAVRITGTCQYATNS